MSSSVEGEHTHRVALITGGSQGIGFATARMLADRGARVVIVARNSAAAEQAAASLPNDAFAIAADLASASECSRCVAETLSRAGGLHILVNCAGAAPMVPIPDVT